MKALRAASAVVALAGLAIATYLSIVHLEGKAPACAIAHGCQTVQESEWSELAGIPVAYLGAAGYVTMLIGLAWDSRIAREGTALTALVGCGFSLWLTYVEIFEIDAICIWCVGSAIAMTVLAVLTTVRLVRLSPGSGAGSSRRPRRAGRSPANAPGAARRP